MKKFLYQLSIFISVPLSAFVVLVLAHLLLPRMSDYDFDGGLRIKHNLILNNKDHKKIVLIGGSNLAMGFDSKTIAQNFPDYQVINYGHRFQYGLEFFFNEIQPYLNKGDIVVIVPEYQLILSNYFGHQDISKVWFERLNHSHIPMNNIEPRNFIDYAIERIHFLKALKKGYFQRKDNFNKVTDFNEFGDSKGHWNFKPVKWNLYEEPKELSVSDETVNTTRSFLMNCKAKQIRVFLIPPMYSRSNFNINKNLVKFNTDFWNKINLPYLCPPEEMVLEDGYFYDSPYHLLAGGIKIKTEKINSLLKKILNIQKP